MVSLLLLHCTLGIRQLSLLPCSLGIHLIMSVSPLGVQLPSITRAMNLPDFDLFQGFPGSPERWRNLLGNCFWQKHSSKLWGQNGCYHLEFLFSPSHLKLHQESTTLKSIMWPIMFFGCLKWRSVHRPWELCVLGYEYILLCSPLHLTKLYLDVYIWVCVSARLCLCKSEGIFFRFSSHPTMLRQDVSSFWSLCPPSQVVVCSPFSPPSHCRNSGIIDTCHLCIASFLFIYFIVDSRYQLRLWHLWGKSFLITYLPCPRLYLL